jgi:trehalose 6-phosphate synthase/phosphatase
MQQGLKEHYQIAKHRLFLLDYDGTLAEIAPTPPQAAPTDELRDLLGQLASLPQTTVVIISGRDRTTLDNWLGDLPLHFAAEHGFWRKTPLAGWQFAGEGTDEVWKQPVARLMDQATRTFPGTFTEEKTTSLAWHYRALANDSRATQAAQSLLSELVPLQDKAGIRIINGNKVIEVQPFGTDKGTAAQYWLSQQKWEFILAAGDDVTDEDLLGAMPDSAFTFKIGYGESLARLRLSTPQALRDLLRSLLQ